VHEKLIIDGGEITGHLREGVAEALRERRDIGTVNKAVTHSRRIKQVTIEYEDVFTPVKPSQDILRNS
jgi:hypothetical protein